MWFRRRCSQLLSVLKELPVRVSAAVSRVAGGLLSIENLDLGPPQEGEIRVRLAAVGVCHTDLSAHDGSPDRMPIVFGHEGAGVVEEVGTGVTKVRVGDHVVMSYDSCGGCRPCLDGHPAHCREFIGRNFSGRRMDGTTSLVDARGGEVGSRWFGQSAFATAAIGTERNVVVVSDDLPLELLAPLGCSIQTGAASVLIGLRAGPGSTIAVFGAGSVGLSAVLAARLAGCAKIIVVDLNANRLALARTFGATETVPGDDPELVDKIRSSTGGGVDATLDTTAMPHVIADAVACLLSGGTAGLVGLRGELRLPADVFTGGRSIRYLIEGDAVPQQFVPFLIERWRNGTFPFETMLRHYDFQALDHALADTASGETVKAVVRLPSSP
jgi:aryl-alcohol dehydrogenase